MVSDENESEDGDGGEERSETDPSAYTVVDPTDLEPLEGRPSDCRRISDVAGLEGVAINRFLAEPGEQLPLTYHYHERQEEAFTVLSGELAVETPDGEFRVPEGAVFTAEPEAPHRAYNPEDATAPVEVLAIGAPSVDGDAVPYDPDES
ncbi:cupin [Halobiforma lacisalsi AJ5]|uniref:Cupin n=1 Tax=Natronobacterium lacisalsi AJ5 TaxID=358396 RepID=M0LJT7_NATLA|nr:cupin domain-containing protein [Halobiforma lacisalsi]APW97285.1 cupin [Halobiforma lacisalsi AJ5]EMA33796.1 cupin [Halobiforma lacisalsi AJ5]